MWNVGRRPSRRGSSAIRNESTPASYAPRAPPPERTIATRGPSPISSALVGASTVTAASYRTPHEGGSRVAPAACADTAHEPALRGGALAPHARKTSRHERAAERATRVGGGKRQRKRRDRPRRERRRQAPTDRGGAFARHRRVDRDRDT